MPSQKTPMRAPRTAATTTPTSPAPGVEQPKPAAKTQAQRAAVAPKPLRAARKATAPAAQPKAAAPAATAKVAKEAKEPSKLPRPKLVRDGFTMPEADFGLIAMLKARAIEAKRPAKKSELLRAGLQALMDMPAAQLVAALTALEPIKTGRPKKGQ